MSAKADWRGIISQLIFTVSGLLFLVLYFWVESQIVRKRRKQIPLCICITGARGKSSVTRLLKSVLHNAGYSVLAKTTGSQPMIHLPDGTEKEIKRRGLPLVLEQKKILKAAVSLKAQALVIEMMSIRSESLHVESHRLLQPDILVITNIFPDHRQQWGNTQESVASSLAAAIHDKCQVFMPAEEVYPVFQTLPLRNPAIIHAVSWRKNQTQNLEAAATPAYEFEANVQLALAVADHIGIPEEQAALALKQSSPDFGSLKAWLVRETEAERTRFCVSVFAANDPQSCQHALRKLKQIPDLNGKPWLGLLNLRRDRGDRSLQWAEAIALGRFPEMEKIGIIGDHVQAFERKCVALANQTTLLPLNEKSPHKIMESLFRLEPEEMVVVGMGNMAGAGRALVEYWQEKGESACFLKPC